MKKLAGEVSVRNLPSIGPEFPSHDRPMIYILEDDEERVRQFRAAVAAIAPNMPVRFWRDAHAMIADLVKVWNMRRSSRWTMT